MISQRQTQKQQLKILPRQIQLLHLFFLNSIELEQRISNEMEENPLLEQCDEQQYEEADLFAQDPLRDCADWEEYNNGDATDYRAEYLNYFSAQDAPNIPIQNLVHFKEEAKQQLRLLSLCDEDLEIVTYLIDVLNSHGLMDKPLQEVADDLSFAKQRIIDEDAILRGLDIVQTLDPIGLGARSVRECLLLQLRAMNRKRPDVRCALKLIEHHYNDLTHRKFEEVYKALGIDEGELRIILSIIGKLKFYPITESVSQYEPKATITPDFILTRIGETNYQVNLHSPKANSVFVNMSLYDQLARQDSKDRGATQYVKSKLQSAQWFVHAVKQREETMMKIMQCIVQIQQAYFLEGDIRLLKPMVLRNVADKAGFDISTVSRITSNKYVETQFGLICLKDLFTEGIADKKGELVSNKVIQSMIVEAIGSEDKCHPYTDQQLICLLSEKGYSIARRTVAKYRQQMNIPIAQIRSAWA